MKKLISKAIKCEDGKIRHKRKDSHLKQYEVIGW